MPRLLALISLIGCFLSPYTAKAVPLAYLMTLHGVVGPASVRYITQGLTQARARDARLVMIEIDTSGGQWLPTRRIVQTILSSPVPVVGLVYPRGAHPGRAGIDILYACSMASMAPSTLLDARAFRRTALFASSRTIPHKWWAAMATEIRISARRYGRNANWAVEAILRGGRLSAAGALRRHVIDFLATNPQAFLLALDGRRIRSENGWQLLHTEQLDLDTASPEWKDHLLTMITDPNITYLLLIIGLFGIIFELAGPGMILPGTVGLVALVLALLAMQALPIDYGGLALMIVGIALMVADGYLIRFRLLGIGGIAAFTTGSLLLFNHRDIQVSLSMIGGLSILSAIFFLWFIRRLLRLRRRGAISGREVIIGAHGVVVNDFVGHGQIHLNGELWQAKCLQPLHQGQRVHVIAVKGLTLEVLPDEV